MNALNQLRDAGFTLKLLPNDKLGVKPNTLTQQQREYVMINKAEIIRDLQLDKIQDWLYKIGEPPEDHHLVLDKCRRDKSALHYFLKQAGNELATPPEIELADLKLKERRNKALAILADNPGIQRTFITDMNSNPDNVILTIAIRDQHTFEMLIPKDKYDAFLILEIFK